MGEDPLRLYARFHAQLNGLNPADYEKQLEAESSFNPSAVSPKGARGVAQFMPATGRDYGMNTPEDRHDPIKSIAAGAKYMADLKVQAGGDERAARVGYNAGPRAMKRYKAGGAIPAETKGYISQIGDDPEELYKRFQAKLASSVPATEGVNVSSGKPMRVRPEAVGGREFEIPSGGFAHTPAQNIAIAKGSERPFVPAPGKGMTLDDLVLTGAGGKLNAPMKKNPEADARYRQRLATEKSQKEQAPYLLSLSPEKRRAAAVEIARREPLSEEAKKLAGFGVVEKIFQATAGPFLSTVGETVKGIGKKAEQIAPYIGYDDYHSALTKYGGDITAASEHMRNMGPSGPVAEFAGGLSGTLPLVAALPAGLTPIAVQSYLGSIGRGEDESTALKHAVVTVAGLSAGGVVGRQLEQQVQGTITRYLARSTGAATGLEAMSLGSGEPQTPGAVGQRIGMGLVFGAHSRKPRPVPESTATINAQIEAMQAGRRPAVELTGQSIRPPVGIKTMRVGGSDWLYDPKQISANDFRKQVDNGTIHKRLGYVEPKPAEEELAATVVARGPDGREVQAAVVSPEAVETQAETLKSQHPQASVAVEPAEKVLAERAAASEHHSRSQPRTEAGEFDGPPRPAIPPIGTAAEAPVGNVIQRIAPPVESTPPITPAASPRDVEAARSEAERVKAAQGEYDVLGPENFGIPEEGRPERRQNVGASPTGVERRIPYEPLAADIATPEVQASRNIRDVIPPLKATERSVAEAKPQSVRVWRGQPSDEPLRGDMGEFGIHFGDEGVAEQFGDVIPYDLTLKNPLRMPDVGVWSSERILDQLRKQKVISVDEANVLRAKTDTLRQRLGPEPSDNEGMAAVRRHSFALSEPVRTALKQKGYDGIIYKNESEGFADSYIAFNDSQWKRVEVPTSKSEPRPDNDIAPKGKANAQGFESIDGQRVFVIRNPDGEAILTQRTGEAPIVRKGYENRPALIEIAARSVRSEVPQVEATSPESEVRLNLRAGQGPDLKAKVIFRPVGSNQAVVEIKGQRFTIDNSRRLVDAGVTLDSSEKQATLRGKTQRDVTAFFNQYPKLTAEDFAIRAPKLPKPTEPKSSVAPKADVQAKPTPAEPAAAPSAGASVEKAYQRQMDDYRGRFTEGVTHETAGGHATISREVSKPTPEFADALRGAYHQTIGRTDRKPYRRFNVGGEDFYALLNQRYSVWEIYSGKSEGAQRPVFSVSTDSVSGPVKAFIGQIGKPAEPAKAAPPLPKQGQVSSVGARKGTPEGLARVETARQHLRDVINNKDLGSRERADAIDNGKQLIAFLEAHADTRKPLDTSVFKGDEIAYTGVTNADGFREFIYLDGAKAGDYGVTMTKTEKASISARNQAEYRQQQEEFGRLANTKPVERAGKVEPSVKLEGVQPSEKPKRTRKPKQASIDSETLDLVAYIRNRGGVNLGSLTGEARHMREGRLRQPGVITKNGLKWDDMETALRSEGYLQEGESLLDALDDAGRGKKRYANSSAYDEQIDQETALYSVGLTGRVSADDASIVIKRGIGDPKWSGLVYEVLNHEAKPTEQTVRAFRTASDKLGISDRAIEDILRAGEYGRSSSATEFAFGEESDTSAPARVETPLTTTQIDRVREVEERLHESGESLDKFLSQRGLTTADELNPAEADLLREMRANRSKRRKPDESEQGAMFDTAPTVESKAEAQAREPKPNVNFGLFADVEAEPAKTPKSKAATFIPETREEVTAKSYLVSDDAADAMRARIKARQKKGQAGFIGEREAGKEGLPGGTEALKDYLGLAVYHVERGARDFADFAKRMIEDAGGWIKPHLADLHDRAISAIDLTGIKNAAVADQRIVRGLDPIETEYHKSFPESRAEGVEMVESDVNFRAKVADWAKRPRPLTDAEDAALVYDRTKLHNAHKAAMEEILAAQKKGDVPAEAAATDKRDAVEEQMQIADVAAKRTGTEWGRGGSARRMMMKEDYSLATLVQKGRVANEGNPVDAETRAKLAEVSTALEAKIKEFDDYREQASKREMELTAGRLERETRQARRVKKVVDLDAEYDTLIAQIRGPAEPRGGAEAGTAIVDAELLMLIGKLARNRVEKGIVKAEELVDTIYEAVKDRIPGVEARDVRDAISGYGQPPKQTRTQAQSDLARIKRELAKLSRTEDKGPDAARQKAQVKRLEKRKERLEKQLATGNFAPVQRARVPLDPGAQKIQVEIDGLKKQADERIKTITTERLRKGFDPKDLDRDVRWYDYVRSPLSNLNYRGTYERVGGLHGYEASEILRQAQVDVATGDVTRQEALTRARKDILPIQKALRAAGKPGLSRMLTEHIEAVRDPDAAFRGLAGFLKAFQYHTKLRFNPRATLINELQPLQTLWPHLTTAEFAGIAVEARKPSVRKRIAELADRESGGKVEIKEGKRHLDMFSKASESNRIMGHLAGELLGKRQGLEGPELERYAADWAKKTEFDNSRWDIPPLFRGNVAGVVGQFKPFMVKNIERLFADWKRSPEGTSSGTLARRAKMITSQALIGGARSVPGLKAIGGVLILGALAKSFQKVGLSEDDANKLAETVYFGAPGLIEQDLSGSVMIVDEPFGNTPAEKMINFAGGPTLGLIHAAWKEGGRAIEAKDTAQGTAKEKRAAAALRFGKAITPLVKTGETLVRMAQGKTPTMNLAGKKQPMTTGEAIGYGLQGTPKSQTEFYDEKDAYDWQRRLAQRLGLKRPKPASGVRSNTRPLPRMN